mmetsp:Transcript_30917/g.41977  ORF Transcript_30917/g.41977 Transcript_30917/m.41977 type:complete len:212 (+) Transcript_30917:31-666(+)
MALVVLEIGAPPARSKFSQGRKTGHRGTTKSGAVSTPRVHVNRLAQTDVATGVGWCSRPSRWQALAAWRSSVSAGMAGEVDVLRSDDVVWSAKGASRSKLRWDVPSGSSCWLSASMPRTILPPAASAWPLSSQRPPAPRATSPRATTSLRPPGKRPEAPDLGRVSASNHPASSEALLRSACPFKDAALIVGHKSADCVEKSELQHLPQHAH